MVAERSTPSLHTTVEPKQTWRLFWDRLFRAALPTIFLMAVTVILSAPFGFPGREELQFGVALCAVWFWGHKRPRLMPVSAVFLCGCCLELFSFGPPGLGLLAMLSLYGCARHWRYIFTQIGFLAVWLIFTCLIIIILFIQWVLVCIHAVALLSPMPGLFQAMLTIGMYPSLMAVFSWGSQRFADPDRA